MPEMLQNSEGSRSIPEKSAGTAFPRVPAPLHYCVVKTCTAALEAATRRCLKMQR